MLDCARRCVTDLSLVNKFNFQGMKEPSVIEGGFAPHFTAQTIVLDQLLILFGPTLLLLRCPFTLAGQVFRCMTFQFTQPTPDQGATHTSTAPNGRTSVAMLHYDRHRLSFEFLALMPACSFHSPPCFESLYESRLGSRDHRGKPIYRSDAGGVDF